MNVWYVLLPYGNTADPHGSQEDAAQLIYDAINEDVQFMGLMPLADKFEWSHTTVVEPTSRLQHPHSYTNQVITEMTAHVRNAPDLLEAFPVFIGGEHTITYSALRALQALNRPAPTLMVLDAHCDDWESETDGGLDHGSWERDVMAEGLADTITNNYVRMSATDDHRYRSLIYNSVAAITPTGGSVHLSIDMDVFDPAFVPGVSHPVPFGPTPREVLDQILVVAASGHLKSFDVNEASTDDATVALAAGLITAVLSALSPSPGASEPASA